MQRAHKKEPAILKILELLSMPLTPSFFLYKMYEILFRLFPTSVFGSCIFSHEVLYALFDLDTLSTLRVLSPELFKLARNALRFLSCRNSGHAAAGAQACLLASGPARQLLVSVGPSTYPDGASREPLNLKPPESFQIQLEGLRWPTRRQLRNLTLRGY